MNVDKCEVMESDEHENTENEGMEDEVILQAFTVGENKKYKLRESSSSCLFSEI